MFTLVVAAAAFQFGLGGYFGSKSDSLHLLYFDLSWKAAQDVLQQCSGAFHLLVAIKSDQMRAFQE